MKPLYEKLRVVEGIHGTYHYHLQAPDCARALCCAMVMSTEIPLEAWGTVTHLHERYCKVCDDMGRDVLPASSKRSP